MFRVYLVYNPEQEGCFLEQDIDKYLRQKHVSASFEQEDNERIVEWEAKSRRRAVTMIERITDVRFRGDYRVVLSRDE
jgi:hypothetical protein